MVTKVLYILIVGCEAAFWVVLFSGSTMIRWADQRFAHSFAGGPPPSKASSHGWASVLYELKLWGLCILATCIIYILLVAMIGFADQPDDTEALEVWFRIPLGAVFFWFIFGPLWSLVFFKRAPSRAATEVQ